MKVKIVTIQGWTEAIIDDDCGFDKYYRIAGILTKDFNVRFTEKLSDLNSVYQDFEFKGSRLSLHYNIYVGTSVYPTACKDSSTTDNESVLEIGQLLFNKVIDLDWKPFNNGGTIGQSGTERGQIIADLENIKGARITLEEHADSAPFAVTLGIYGLMMHTHFESDINNANDYVTQSKFKINKIIELYEAEAEKPTNYGQTKFYKMIDELAEMTDVRRPDLENKSLLGAPGINKKAWWKKMLGI